MKGLVINKNANLFLVECNEKHYIVSPSGKTRAKGIFVGDYVEFDESITSDLSDDEKEIDRRVVKKIIEKLLEDKK